MSEENKPKKKPEWKSDPKITMTIKKGDLWIPDKNLKMIVQETLEKKKKKPQ